MFFPRVKIKHAICIFCTLTLGVFAAISPVRAASSLTQAQPAHDNVEIASIGGRFLLENQDGQIVSDEDFKGRFMLITFGYTYCPDVCPTNLTNMSEALGFLGTKADKVAPIFITVDPKRDTAQVLRKYVANFDDRIIGLTGSEEMIEHVKTDYNVTGKAYHPEGWAADEYLVDHTASIFLMSPDGKFLVKFAHGMHPEDMAKRIEDFMQ